MLRHCAFSAAILTLLPFVPVCLTLGQSRWAIPKEAPLLTSWSADINPEAPLPEYPRPQMVRAEWLNLNGLWEYELPASLTAPPFQKKLEGIILVPYPIESALSGVMRRADRLWYRRTFSLPSPWKGKHILLHFGAADWEATVYVNGKLMGMHRGGYDPFSFDITDALNAGGPREIIVGVFDPCDEGDQPRGKQVRNPNGIWYTPCTGIWQTVWCEPVPESYITQVNIVPGNDAKSFGVTVSTNGENATDDCLVTVLEGKTRLAQAAGRVGTQLSLPIPAPKLWSPESPFLYDVQVSLRKGRKEWRSHSELCRHEKCGCCS